uniref:Uncharacterized protein n=1 Tax=Anguilla anguilla TaxID=7936 RepID=A0A0E9T0Z7_ANGAN
MGDPNYPKKTNNEQATCSASEEKGVSC